MKTKKRINLFLSFLFAFLVVILIGFFIHVERTFQFNKKLISISDNRNDFNCQMNILPRLVDSGSWIKKGTKIGDRTVDLNAKIYDATLLNYSKSKISDWKLKINIHQDCFINNAWCGTVEIHQNVASGNEIVQTLDLRNLSGTNIKLEHFVDTQDVLIHLNEGDYIIYNPGLNQNEMPVYAFNGAPGSTTVGFIFYYFDKMDFSDFQLDFHFKKSLYQGAEFSVFVAFLIVWLIAMIYVCIFIYFSKKNESELKSKVEMLEESLGLISHFVDAKDTYTQGHSYRVAEYSEMLAKKLGFTGQNARYVYYAGILHDVGKCYVPDNVLKKPGKLTDDEFAIIKSHTTSGGEMLAGITSIPGISEGAKFHHERYDGRGYPTGLAGNNIPLISRIICVADSFDAMNSSRCYRKNLTKDYILSEIERCKGSQFDPEIAQALLELINDGKIKISEETC